MSDEDSVKVFFSVIVPNWNGRHYLKECFDSLGRQKFQDFETILVDNGSNDGSIEFVEEEFPRVRILPLSINSGFAVGVNHGIVAGKGEYIVLLNNDTEVDSNWLQNLYAAIQRHPEVVIFGSRLLNYYNRSCIDSAGDSVDLCLGPYKIGEHQPTSDYIQEGFIFGACGGGGCYNRTLFETIGLFDEDFFAYFEDTDLSFRANWAGYRCISVPDAVIYHKVGGTSDTNQARKDRFDIMRRRNFFFMIIKNYPASFLLRSLPFILASHWLVFLKNVLRGRFRVAFMTQWEILKGLPGMLRKRSSILATRRISNREMLSRCVPKYGSWAGFVSKKFNSVFAR